MQALAANMGGRHLQLGVPFLYVDMNGKPKQYREPFHDDIYNAIPSRATWADEVLAKAIVQPMQAIVLVEDKEWEPFM